MTQPALAADPPAPPLPQPRATPEPSTLARLRVPPMTDRLLGWIVTLAITAVAFALRVYRLGSPNSLIFDETYYAKDAWTLLHFGYERSWPKEADAQIIAGNTNGWLDTASFIVHPPVGKWLIAFGEQIFGMNSVGWRVGPLIFGTLLVLITIRLVRRVSRSTLIGGVAGLLLALDGLALVMSRSALLDIFLAVFLLAAVSCLAADRDWFRNRLADHLRRSGLPDLRGAFGPAVIIRPWRIAAGVLFGLALGTKWSALYVIAAFAVLSLAWDLGARRLAGGGRFRPLRLLRDGWPTFVALVVLPIPVYVATWAGWLSTSGGYLRDWGSKNPNHWTVKILGDGLASLLQYQKSIYEFHTGSFINNATHAYDAAPSGWLIIARPLSMYVANDLKPGTAGCTGPDNCISVVLAIGTPALWWAGVIALIAAAILWIGARDWRFGIPIVGALSVWLPWFQYDDRPTFYFYAIAIIPFTVMAVALCLGKILGPAGAGNRRMLGAVAVGTFVALVGANFAYIYPILADQVIPYPQWRARMWFRSWI